MTGREAIYHVHALREDQVRAILNRPVQKATATLRRVCEWFVNDPDGWSGLLADLGLVELPRKRSMQDAIALWRERYWTDVELAQATGVSAVSLRLMRRTNLRDETWSYRAAGNNLKAYKLVTERVTL
jgi:hypothetical protein